MKKTLAIVLALVMVLCMIPAMSAGTEYKEDITSHSYTINGFYFDNAGTWTAMEGGTGATKANSTTIKYVWDTLEANNKVHTGKWSEDAVVVAVELKGFIDKAKADLKEAKVYVDGKELTAGDEYTAYKNSIGWIGNGQVNFPVEVTKAGYKDTFEVKLTGKYAKGDDTINYTETAVVTVTFQNTAEYKNVKTASITNIKSSDEKKLYAYIVGSKIYLDFTDSRIDLAAGTTADEKLEITFADENGKPFTGITWAYNPRKKTGSSGFAVEAATGASTKNFTEGYGDWKNRAAKLKDSKGYYSFTIANKSDIQFLLETSSAVYETKKYDVVVRKGIAPADPKGIYFADTVKTIKVGETYSPVVMGVATGKPVAVEKINIGKESDIVVLDKVNDTTIVGVKEGVAYITAEYTYINAQGANVPYTASSMKIVVTEGESIPPAVPTTTTYIVSCRNLNVRKGAGTSYAKAGMVHRGDALEVVEIANNWAKLANGNYVCAKYIYKK